VCSLRRDLRDRITAEQALKMHREYLEQRDKKLGMRVRNKKPTMEPKAVAPRAGRSRAGGSKKGRKAKSPKQVVADDTEGVAWCEEVLRGPLRKQADCERYRRSLAANTATAPDPPACIGSVNLHGYSVATAIEVLRSQIIGAKPRKKCNHLMVITGKSTGASRAKCAKIWTVRGMRLTPPNERAMAPVPTDSTSRLRRNCRGTSNRPGNHRFHQCAPESR
jgi:hypothetical protein